MQAGSVDTVDSFTLRYVTRALAGLGVILVSIALGAYARDILDVPVAFGVCLWLIFGSVNQASRLRWRRSISGLAGLVIFLIYLCVLFVFEDSIHFFVVRPLYEIEVAFLKTGKDGFKHKQWKWPASLSWGENVLVYDNRPNAYTAGVRKDHACSETVHALATSFFLVRTVCWS